MRRIEIFQNNDKSFNADFFASVISSLLNEKIEIKIGMQLCDCTQYKPE